MSIDQHPYLLIYLFGSISVVVLTLVKAVLFLFVDWIIKANILKKNIKKLTKPDDTRWYLKAVKFFGTILLEAPLSWINVAVISWQILFGIVKVLRELFTPAPEEVKALRFPLRNNPMLSKEAVWAYLVALNVKVGEALQDEHSILASIEDIVENRPDFDCFNALDQLAALKAIPIETISSVKSKLPEKVNEEMGWSRFDLA